MRRARSIRGIITRAKCAAVVGAVVKGTPAAQHVVTQTDQALKNK